MKPKMLFMLLIALCLGCLFIFRGYLNHMEQKSRLAELQDKGGQLVGLISIYPVDLYGTEKRDLILRTIMGSIPPTQFRYLSIHDRKGKQVISLAPSNADAAVPGEILSKSLFSNGSTLQTFKPAGQGEPVYEFSKPVFEGNLRTGTVRLGLKPAASSLWPAEQVSLLAMIAFFILSALLIGYYGIARALNPLGNIKASLQRICDEGNAASNFRSGTNIGSISEELEKSLSQLKEKLDLIQTENIGLVSKIGALEFENNQILKTLDLIPTGILITDLQGHVVHINGFMQRRLGKSRGDVMDRPLDETLPEPKIQELILAESNIEQRSTLLESPSFAPEDSFLVTVSYILDNENVPVSRLIIFREMTAAKRAEQAQSHFIAQVAHELRTPLTNIRSYNEMLMVGEVIDDETKKNFYNTIHQETARLADLIHNLLNISQIEVGGMTLEKKLVRTDWFVDSCMNSVEASAREKNITIEKKLPDVYPSLIADKELLKAAIINVLGNAVKYTPEFGKVTFSISETAGLVLFEVADTGYGIAPEDLPNIFKKFYRSDCADIKAQTGSGLGLAIASEIVQLHGGDIEVASEPGKGSRFSIKIPWEEFHIGRK
jgi:signal transduction histidine kinase